ncbi:hypothetical protein P43SY_007909 [Pythium insidiosum]|uniref:Kinesin light chain n=1 Tax=Pythium insidiosum TaxID=114742 RepID=A0AAD5M392_PYTIN|nr:hypothetical protein P43SY_007909 [Pythium insidiosum]
MPHDEAQDSEELHGSRQPEDQAEPSPPRELGSKSSLATLEDYRFIENQKELVALQRLDDKCTQLQQEGRYTEALECMEKGLVLRQHFFGADSDEVWQSCKTVGEMCNLLAMTYLQQDEFPVVLELLKKAEILTEKHPAGRAVTLNNLACYYRRQGNLHKALTYLTDALKIESRLDNIPNRADTHLNMCAVLSQLGKHQSALQHAQSALILLHEELQVGGGATNQHGGVSRLDSPVRVDASKLDRIAVLGIAYHNVGVEHEFLKCWDLSLQSYRKGVELTSRFLGESHGIVITLQNSMLTARRAMAARGRSDGATGDGITPKLPKRLAAQASQPKSMAKAAPTRLPRIHSHSRIATDG